MSILSIIFGQRRTVIGAKDSGLGGFLGNLNGIARQQFGGVAGIMVDATISEEHLMTCELTENPVEDGAQITDHVQLKPKQLTIEGVISDYPLGYAIIGNIQNIGRSVTNLFGSKSRSIDAFNDLEKLQKTRQPFIVITGLKRYENMILESLSVPRDNTTGKAIRFKAVMKQIRIVSSQTTGLALDSSVSSLGSPTRDLGQQVTDPVSQSTPLSSTSNVNSSLSDDSLLQQFMLNGSTQ